MARILGIDPGSVVTGYGVIESEAGRMTYVGSGCIRLPSTALAERLRTLYCELGELIGKYRPDRMAVEEVFVSRNASSALKLGHARGAILCVGAAAGLPIAEYSTTEVKQAVTGTGRAEKLQVQHMVKVLLGLRGRLQADEADALAVAVCHANCSATAMRIGDAARRAQR
jgi:crossover junction endodeoxyribonuclease RuvC